MKNLILPQNKTDWTEEQKKQVIAFYAELPVKEIRQRQSFNNQYIGMIYAEHVRFGFRTDSDLMSPSLEQSLANIRVDEDLLIQAMLTKLK